MATIIANGVSVTVNGLEAQGADFSKVEHTLRLLPTAHIRKIPPITVGDRPSRGGGGSATSMMPGGPYIRLNSSCFQSAWNHGHNNYTLLHEIGHIIDWAYGCMETMRRQDQSGYAALLIHPHHGATHGPGEHYADAYADYFSRGRHWLARCAPGRYNALCNSAAFRMSF